MKIRRLCCMQEHFGAQCPDGLVMCCNCFERFPIEELSKDENGTPIDVCLPCRAHEVTIMSQRKLSENHD